MTTLLSPLRALKAQADRIARNLKEIESGKRIAPDPAGKLAEARKHDEMIFGIVMDDKIVKITIPWKTIREFGEVALSEFVLKQMKGTRDNG